MKLNNLSIFREQVIACEPLAWKHFAQLFTAENIQQMQPVEPEEMEDDESPLEIENGVAYFEVEGMIVQKAPSCKAGVVCKDDFIETKEIVDALKAFKDSSLTRLVVSVRSPGGTVGGIDSICSYVSEIVASGKEVIVYADEMCSSAYWAFCSASAIFCSTTSNIGGIGVYSVSRDTTGMQKAIGIVTRLFSSGKMKGLGADGAITPDLESELQSRVNYLADLFAKCVKKNRALVADSVYDGSCYIGEQAGMVGLVDGLAKSEEEALTQFDKLKNV